MTQASTRTGISVFDSSSSAEGGGKDCASAPSSDSAGAGETSIDTYKHTTTRTG